MHVQALFFCGQNSYTECAMKTNTQTKEDRILLAQLEDKQRQAEDWCTITCGDFLDAHQRKLAEDFCRRRGLGPISCKGWSGVRTIFYGGYDEAERCMPVFLPEYAASSGAAEALAKGGSVEALAENELEEELAELLRVVRVHAPAAGRKLAHRDYLGSLLALGLDRSVTGDILVRDQDSALGPGADIIVAAEIADFIELNYSKAGRTELEVEILPIKELHVEPPNLETRHDTVASLRLDSIVASAFRMSRAKAAEAIRRGLVSVNSAEALKVDAEVEEGDRIVLRGQGKIRLSEVGGSTRKDRIRIIISAYR